jgi:vancomycin permeability regulator SanA
MRDRVGEDMGKLSHGKRTAILISSIAIVCIAAIVYVVVTGQWINACALITIALVILDAALFLEFVYWIKTDLCSYRTLHFGSWAFFVAIPAISSLILDVSLFNTHEYLAVKSVASDVLVLSFNRFIGAAFPVFIVLVIYLMICNVVLLRWEWEVKVDLTGIVAGMLLVTAACACTMPISSLPGSISLERDAAYCIQYVLSSLFCFFLATLLSTVICTLVAIKRTPKRDKDFVIILGCGLWVDGTPTPLLKDRLNGAFVFWRTQCGSPEGKIARFVPSGGQGPGEELPEAESMKAYLLDKGVPDELILTESRSTSTFENLSFSKGILDTYMQDAKIAVATSDYHVFRSVMLAKQIGLAAEGIASSSSWYFFPNAFLREFACLVVGAWKIELVSFGAIALMTGAIALWG